MRLNQLCGKVSAYEPFDKLDELDYSRRLGRNRRPSHAFAPRSPHRGSVSAERLAQPLSKRRASRSKPVDETVDDFEWNESGNCGLRVQGMVGKHRPTEIGESELPCLQALRRLPAIREEKTSNDNPCRPVREFRPGERAFCNSVRPSALPAILNLSIARPTSRFDAPIRARWLRNRRRKLAAWAAVKARLAGRPGPR